MAEIRVPTLQRIQPSAAMPQNDRINVNVQSQANNILKTTNAIGGLIGGVDEIYTASEDAKIETISNENELEYSSWKENELQKLRSYEGDPTDAYAQFDIDENEKRKEILGKLENASERVKGHVQSRLDKSIDSQRNGVLKQRGLQQETYENNVFESTVELKRNNMPVVAGYIKKDDPASFSDFDNQISDMRTLVAKRGIKRGTSYVVEPGAKYDHKFVSEEGEEVFVKMSDIDKQKLAKESSQGVVSSIEVLLANGSTEEAKNIHNIYKGYIDAKSAATLSRKFETQDVKNKAFEIAGSLEGLSFEQQKKELAKVEDYKVKSEVLKIVNTNENRIEQLTKRQQDQNYEALDKVITERQRSKNPYYGLADLENDPKYKLMFDKASAKQQRALEELIISPKEDDPDAEQKVQETLSGQNPDIPLTSLTPAKFRELTVGLKASTKSRYTTIFNSLSVETASEKRATYKRADQLLYGHLLSQKFIKGDGKASDKIKLVQARNKLYDELDRYGTATINEKQLNDFTKSYAESVKKGETFNPPAQPIPQAPKTTAKTEKVKELTPEQEAAQKQYTTKKLMEYKKAEKLKDYPTRTNPDFIKWLKANP